MNRRRQEIPQKLSLAAMISLIVAGAIGASGGVAYVHFRNCQIKTAREIDAVERRIEQHRLDIRTAQMRADQALNLFAIRQTLQDLGTDLIPIPAGVSEDVLPVDGPSAAATASTSL
jgi:hypothetical protein